MTSTYPCQPLTNNYAPTLQSVSAQDTQLGKASTFSLSCTSAKVDDASISNLSIVSGSLGLTVSGTELTAGDLTVLDDTVVDSADFGTLALPIQTLLRGVGLQPNLQTVIATAVYTIPCQTPHLAVLFVAPPVGNAGIVTLSDSPSLSFPPLGYRLTIVNVSISNKFSVVSPNASVTALARGNAQPFSSVFVDSRTGFIFVWTGATWLFSFVT